MDCMKVSFGLCNHEKPNQYLLFMVKFWQMCNYERLVKLGIGDSGKGGSLKGPSPIYKVLFIKWGSYPSIDYELKETNECDIIIFLSVQVMRFNLESKR